MFKQTIRSLTPAFLLRWYHFVLAKIAAAYYRHPSRQLIVIGVTGTNGKSTTVQFIGRLLESTGKKVGWTSTAGFKVARNEWVNDQKMTMLGRFQTQKLLREMVDAGCSHAVVETSSQGIEQYRHIGIEYDVAVFTNLTPEHIEAHGGFENYKGAKGKLFSYMASQPQKSIVSFPKTSVINLDDAHASYFLSFNTDGHRIGYSLHPEKTEPIVADRLDVVHLMIGPTGTTFSIDGYPFSFKPLGEFYAANALAAMAACRAVGESFEMLQAGVAALQSVPGRLERIDEGQPFTVIVDYAYEPYALAALYNVVPLFSPKRIIHITGSAGGGRDVARRTEIGSFCAGHDDVVIVTNEDPYDEDPLQIIEAVADGARAGGKQDGVDLYCILSRKEAIAKACALAKSGDLVLITGKGSEPVMAVADGKKIPWDDRAVVRSILHKTISSSVIE